MAIDDLTAKQHKAIAALLTVPTIKEAAEVVGIGERTIHTWLTEQAFDAAYRTARRKAVQQATARLQQLATEAVDVLRSIMTNPAASDRARVAAAAKILDLAYRAIELEDLESRLKALEDAYARS